MPPSEFILGAKKNEEEDGADLDDDATICSCHVGLDTLFWSSTGSAGGDPRLILAECIKGCYLWLHQERHDGAGPDQVQNQSWLGMWWLCANGHLDLQGRDEEGRTHPD